MIARSIVGVLLSIPASIILIALFLAATPPMPAWRVPTLLMLVPVWVGVAAASFLIPKARYSALALVSVSIIGYGLIELLDFAGVGGA
ncbi:MAG: hypothetical protein AAF662_08625 [Pseudomonadota bacterium]